MSAFNSYNKQELKISLFYEVIMSFGLIGQKVCVKTLITLDIY